MVHGFVSLVVHELVVLPPTFYIFVGLFVRHSLLPIGLLQSKSYFMLTSCCVFIS